MTNDEFKERHLKQLEMSKLDGAGTAFSFVDDLEADDRRLLRTFQDDKFAVEYWLAQVKKCEVMRCLHRAGWAY
jgi:hypothetical protein